MKKLQILGPGCFNCKRLLNHAEEAARELGLEAEIEKIEDLNKILSFGVMRTPALAVDGEVVVMGRVPSIPELKGLLEGSERRCEEDRGMSENGSLAGRASQATGGES